ncbi:MAG: DUF4974 domain-containing protein [Bacteroidota bacterium]|nr:DUF4974 domain-containing protein [Bacteroidota bacterium]MDP4205041.1 DUF4974 domain-containing protein [Bacteroidota bacterium]
MKEKIDHNWDLISGKLNKELDKEGTDQFEEWIEQEDNSKLYARAEKIHNGIPKVKMFSDLSPERSWKRIEKRITNSGYGFIRILLPYAAVFIGICILAALLWPKSEKKFQAPVQFAVLKVPYGEMSIVTLTDGTKIWLNSGTTLRYPTHFNQKDREVFLDGEAYFEVAKDKHHPFKVRANKIDVEVLGTSFNINSYHNEKLSAVTLLTGSLRLNDKQGKALGLLKPGQMASYKGEGSDFTISNVLAENYASWKTGIITFDNERIEVIANYIERWYNVDVRFTDESLKNYRCSGAMLKDKPVSQVIKAFELLSPAQFKYKKNPNQKDEIIISEK